MFNYWSNGTDIIATPADRFMEFYSALNPQTWVISQRVGDGVFLNSTHGLVSADPKMVELTAQV